MLNSGEKTRISVIEDLPAFTRLEPEWKALLQASPADCPFLTWEWLHTWWTHLRGTSRLKLLTVRSGEELTAVAPFRLSRGRLAFPQLEFLGTGFAGSDYLDLIARHGHEAEALQAITAHLRSTRLALHLTNASAISLASQLPARLAEYGWSASTAAQDVCPYIKLAGHTWDSYLGTLGSSHRANVRRRLRALEGQFRVQFEQVTTERDRADALATLIAQHQERWGDQSTAFVTPALRAFHDDLTRLAMAAGWLRLYVLRLDETVAAVMYGFHYNQRFYFFQHAFDAKYQQYSLGLALMAMTVRAAIQEGAVEFDMLYGNEPYKSLWAHDQRQLAKMRLFPADIGGALHRRTIAAEQRMRAFVRRMLPNGGRRAA